MEKLPHRQKFLGATIEALVSLGRSASVDEIRDKVIEMMNIPDKLANIPRVSKKGIIDTRTELEYELAWARTQLKGLDYITNSERGVWTLLNKDIDDFQKSNFQKIDFSKLTVKTETEKAESEDWKTILLNALMQIDPSAFERLIQRILRETGFVQVDVTGRTNDGGIDGKGIAKINGMLSFYVVFQAKRYKGSVSAGQIRDFRGAMIGRADKGLFITTGYFTREALKEATREGAPTIDLMDGDKLADKLKSLSLGLKITMIESIEVDTEWFKNI